MPSKPGPDFCAIFDKRERERKNPTTTKAKGWGSLPGPKASVWLPCYLPVLRQIPRRCFCAVLSAYLRRLSSVCKILSIRLRSAGVNRGGFKRALRERSKPSSVRGPVLKPPCVRHRPLRIAGPRQGAPPRVRARAPHRFAVLRSPAISVTPNT